MKFIYSVGANDNDTPRGNNLLIMFSVIFGWNIESLVEEMKDARAIMLTNERGVRSDVISNPQ